MMQLYLSPTMYVMQRLMPRKVNEKVVNQLSNCTENITFLDSVGDFTFENVKATFRPSAQYQCLRVFAYFSRRSDILSFIISLSPLLPFPTITICIFSGESMQPETRQEQAINSFVVTRRRKMSPESKPTLPLKHKCEKNSKYKIHKYRMKSSL